VRKLGCDFYAFSGHKLYGPTGIGVLWGRLDLLKQMPPYHGGGDMIETVSFEKTTYAGLPNKFEAGTPDIAGAIGLGAAIDYVNRIGFDNFEPHEQELLRYGTEKLRQIPGLRFIGTARRKVGVISFRIEDPPISSLDLGQALDREGIAVRTGHHCCMPIMTRLGIDSTTRASFAMYNTIEEIDALADALHRIVEARREKSAGVASSVTTSVEETPFAKASASSPDEAAEQLAEDFDLFGDDRDARGQYVLELGEKLPHTFEMLKQLAPRVQGCMSEVYLLGRPAPDDSKRFEFLADANADIVRGLIAILQRLYSGQPARQVRQFDIEGFFRRIGLDQFISSQRRNGLAGMVQRIRTLAEGIERQEKQPQMNTDEHG
jgi:cysteine desulfurase / selenocysteine lyase